MGVHSGVHAFVHSTTSLFWQNSQCTLYPKGRGKIKRHELKIQRNKQMVARGEGGGGKK